jgi:hypothetical protein
MNCPHCRRPLIKIDYYGELLVGCIECNRAIEAVAHTTGSGFQELADEAFNDPICGLGIRHHIDRRSSRNVPKICSQLHAPKGSKEGSKIAAFAGAGAVRRSRKEKPLPTITEASRQPKDR